MTLIIFTRVKYHRVHDASREILMVLNFYISTHECEDGKKREAVEARVAEMFPNAKRITCTEITKGYQGNAEVVVLLPIESNTQKGSTT